MNTSRLAGLSAEKHIMALVHVARESLSRWCSPTCCVPATRAGLEILKGWDIKCTPLYTEVIAANREWVRGDRVAPAYSVTVGVSFDTPDGVTILDRREDDGFNGHLVISGKTGSRKFLLDMSTWQMDRPQRSIHIPSGVAIELGKPLVGDWSAATNLRDEGKVVYRNHPLVATREWERSPDWTFTDDWHRELHESIVADLRESAMQELEQLQTTQREERP